MEKSLQWIHEAVPRSRRCRTGHQLGAIGESFITRSICSIWKERTGHKNRCTSEKKNCVKFYKTRSCAITRTFPARRQRSCEQSNQRDWKAWSQKSAIRFIARVRE